MRLVLDTNVIVSALLWGGQPFRLLQAAVDGEVELFTSPTLAAELGEILARPRFAPKLHEQATNADLIVALYLEFAKPLSPLTVPRIVPDDPDDDHVVACALAAQADVIVSGDVHLLRLGAHQGVRILTVVQTLSIIAVPTGNN